MLSEQVRASHHPRPLHGQLQLAVWGPAGLGPIKGSTPGPTLYPGLMTRPLPRPHVRHAPRSDAWGGRVCARAADPSSTLRGCWPTLPPTPPLWVCAPHPSDARDHERSLMGGTAHYLPSGLSDARGSFVPGVCAQIYAPPALQPRLCPPSDARDRARARPAVPHRHHQRARPREGRELCAAQGAVLRGQPRHGHCGATGEGGGEGGVITRVAMAWTLWGHR